MCHYLPDFAQRPVTGITSVFHFTDKNIKFKTKECRYSRARVILEHRLCVFHAILRAWLKELYPWQCRVWLELYPRQCRVWLELYPRQCRPPTPVADASVQCAREKSLPLVSTTSIS